MSSSLLQQALQQEGQPSDLSNVLQIDAFLVPSFDITEDSSSPSSSAASSLLLANICLHLNQRLNDIKYPWWKGEPPQFGLHTSTSDEILHLRLQCCYGVSVHDEWFLIHWLLKGATKDLSTLRKQHRSLAFQVWDLDDDDNILLVEGADALPSWVTAADGIDERTLCRNRCWILTATVSEQDNKIVWITPSNGETNGLTTAQALQHLSVADSSTIQPVSSRFHEIICRKVAQYNCFHDSLSPSFVHRTALLLPRSVAFLAQRYPNILAQATVAFYETRSSSKQQSSSSPPDWINDWVWTTAALGRTHYAVLRNLRSSIWPEAMTIPYRSIQLNRLKRQVSDLGTPRHLNGPIALSMGTRLTAGVEQLLEQQKQQMSKGVGSLYERRVYEYWQQHMHSETANWLVEAWRAGPNESPANISDILKCPVFAAELQQPSTHGSSLPSIAPILRLGMEQSETFSNMPTVSQVDVNEDWMSMDKAMPTQDEATTEMVEGVHTFLKGSSGIEGVEQPTVEQLQRPGTVSINPVVFLNMLHTTLKAQSIDELPNASRPRVNQGDPYFSHDDYEAMEDTDDDDNDDEVEELMQAMDRELGRETDEGAATEKVVSNLLQSLETSGPNPGPVKTLLQSMDSAVDR